MYSKIDSNSVRCFFGFNRLANATRYAFFFASVLVLISAFGSEAAGQGTTSGGFKGQVRDNLGKPIPGATVVLKNTNFGTQATAITNENGTYSKGSLPPGLYEITVSAPGFVPKMQTQTLYAMANYVIEPDPFDLVPVGVQTTPTPVVTPDPTTPKPVTPKPEPADKAGDGGGGEPASLSMDTRRVGIFGNQSVVGLPLGNTTLTRTFDELAFLVPGVNPPPQAIGNSVGPGVGGGVGTSGQFSVNGQRSRANNFTVDGSDNNDEDIGVRRQGFFTLIPQPIESIQEFQITTLLAPAEFGRSLGAQVNAISKSGGNQFHGSAFGFANTEKLNARNVFDGAGGDTVTNLTSNGTPAGTRVFVNGVQRRETYDAGEKDEFTLFQGGLAFGGRIVRDKAFFFVSGEGQELNGTQERSFAVPTVEQRGLFGAGATGLMTSTGTPVYPTSVSGDAVFSLFPFANNPNGVYGGNTYSRALSTDANGRIFSGRVDWNIFKINGNQQTFTARYNYTDDERDLTDVGGALFSAVRPQVRTDNFSTFLSGGLKSNVSNELRFSYGRTRLDFEELRDESGFILPVTGYNASTDSRFLLNARVFENFTLPGPNIQQCVVGTVCYLNQGSNNTQTFGGTNRLGPVGQLVIAGFSPVGVDVFNFPQARENITYQFADTVRWQTGRHAFAFGTDIRRVTLDSELPRNSRPLVTFNGGRRCLVFAANGACTSIGVASPLDLAAAGASTGFFQSLVLPGQDSRLNLKYNQLNFFGQDEWRVNSKLLLTFGLRYEYNTTPQEADNKLNSALSAALPPRVAAFSQFIGGRSRIFEPDRNNFAPRVGVAFAPDSKTVIRGGFGLYHDQILGAVVSQSRNIFPRFTTINFGGGNNLFCVNAQSVPVVCTAQGAILLGIQFSLFNPVNGFIGTTPIVQPGTLNTLNSAFVSGSSPTNGFLDTIFNSFPFLSGTPFGGTYPARELDIPMSYQYYAGFERDIYRNNFLSVGYVGTTGRNLLRFTTPNLGSNYLAFVGQIFQAANQPVIVGTTQDPNRPVPGIGPISQFETTGNSQYHSLQIGMRGRIKNVFGYQVNYVYGKVEDDVSDVFDLAGASALPQNSRTFAGEYALANFDVKHRFTYNFTYALPTFSDRSTAVRYIFGDWEIAGTGKFNTGQPFTVNSIFDINLDGNLTDRLDNLSAITVNNRRDNPVSASCRGTAAGCRSSLAAFGADGSVGRNSFRAGNLLDLDLAVSRKFGLTETQNIQFRVDFFNFINRSNYGVPVRFLEAPAFGRAVETITPGRRIQFGLKYNF